MERTPVSSKMIKELGFDPSTQTMEVQFQTGTVYQYEGVTQEVFDSVLNSASVGTAFNQIIKPNYAFTKV